MKFRKPKKSDIIFLIIIAILIIPQTRHPIQVALHSVISKFNPSVIDKEDREKVSYASWKLRDLNGNIALGILTIVKVPKPIINSTTINIKVKKPIMLDFI